jgi:hypothetical protein
MGDEWNEDQQVTSRALTIPDDPLFGEQWGLRNTGQLVEQTVQIGEDEVLISQFGIPGVDINASLAWDITRGSSSIIVGVIEQQDTDLTHPEIRDQLLDDVCGPEVGGCDFIDGDGMDPATSSAHASHVTGIIAARAGNGEGVSGTAPKIKLIPMRGQANLENADSFVQAINYAKSQGARIIHASQGGFGSQDESPINNYFVPAVRDAIIANPDLLFVFSGGNGATARYNFPSSYQGAGSGGQAFAALPNLISVANVDNRGELWVGSSHGEFHVNVAAPGVAILSSINNGDYGTLAGTSMSAAFVTGTAALVMNKFPGLTAAQITERIQATGMKLAGLRGNVRSGAMVDAFAALTDVLRLNNFEATSVAGRVTLSWGAVPNATRYDVERDGVVVNNGTSTTFTHDVPAGSAHFYRVRAIVGGKATLWSRRWMKVAVNDPVLEVLSPAIESAHFPYAANLDEQLVSIDRPGAVRMRIHFQRLETAGSFDTGENDDFVAYCRATSPGCDEGGTNHFFGDYSQGFWTHFASAPFHFWFSTDATNNDFFGYRVDRIEYTRAP